MSICSFLFLSNFSAKNLLINSQHAHQIAAHHFHHLQIWVYQMIIQAHLGIIMALDVMLGWRDKQAIGKICQFGTSCPTFQPKTS
jgi:Ni,Fe-hydrogenase I cytochrome b subunit